MGFIKRAISIFLGLFVVVGIGGYIFTRFYYHTSAPKSPDGIGKVVEVYQVSEDVEDRIRQDGDTFQFVSIDTKTDQVIFSAQLENYFSYNAQKDVIGSGDKPTDKLTFMLTKNYLPLWQTNQARVKDKYSLSRFPIAGTSVYPEIKQLKINGKPVDEVREYVDYDGRTWYLWYYKNLELKNSNIVTFE